MVFQHFNLFGHLTALAAHSPSPWAGQRSADERQLRSI